MKLSAKQGSAARRVLIYGPPKSGKTELVGKLSEVFNLLWFDLEGGVDTLLKLPEDWKGRIEVVSIPDTRANPIAIETCLKAIAGQQGRICEEHGKWNCAICAKDGKPFIDIALNSLAHDTIVVFDSLTQLTNSAISHITKGRPDDYKMQHDDWGSLGKLMDTFLSYVQQSKFHVACISHETEAEMEDGKLKLVPVAGTRSFSRNSAKYFGEVYYCEVKNRRHICGSSTGYASNILTGSRLGAVLESSDTSSLIPVFKGEVSQVSDTQGKTAAPSTSAISKILAAKKS